jgi:RNA-binding protein Musashi
MMDKDTGRPRGFGFVTFDGDAAVDACLQGPLQILGKPIEVKRAQPRGNMREEEENKKFGRGGKFGSRDGFVKQEGGGYDGGQNANQNTANGTMTPAMMAQYWQRMQEYFRQMQQNIAGQGNTMPNPAMMGGMNPAMMGMMSGMGGAGAPQMGGMNPAMMGQFGQPFDQSQFNDPNQGGGYGGNGGNQGGPRPAYNAHEQMAFEQQKYQQQEQRRMQQSAGYGGQGGPTSWEGMYDEIPPPTAVPAGPGGHRSNFGPKNNRARQGSSAPPNAPNAPANAPTGPKNAGKPFSNYRGGGRNLNNFRHNPYGGRG